LVASTDTSCWFDRKNSDQEAIAKLTEHLGTKDAKCEWGNPTSGGGGFLGSERRQNDQLKKELQTCLNNPPVTPPNTEWKPTRKIISTTEGNVVTDIEYEKA